jgi:dUTPase
VLANSEGIVDVDYQQEVFVLMTNISKVAQTIAYQERIAQAEVVVNEGVRLTVLNEMPTAYSERDGGFGSTGSV